MTTATQTSSSSSSTAAASTFDIVQAYHAHLMQSSDTPMQIAAILALCDMVSRSEAGTVSELIITVRQGCDRLREQLSNPVPAIAGMDLFQRFVIMPRNWEGQNDFIAQKNSLVALAREFAANTAPSCRERITELAVPFIRDDAVILTHSYSRVVMQVLMKAAKRYNKRISVYVTEARATGLGMKTYEELTAAGIPCTVILDSAVGYIMSKVDMVLTGAEAVVESGGILNALGTYQIGLIAKAANKPLYSCCESFKFLRLFPLSQDDLPVPHKNTLGFPSSTASARQVKIPSGSFRESPAMSSTPTETQPKPQDARDGQPCLMTKEMLEANPAVDYTPASLMTFLLTDYGALPPSAVNDALLSVYGGPD
ncbi:nagb/rpia/CoA transferase-like protein [Tilletiaria anomala UBC 951]|uniref:Translation initiation factor eIF2B subunit alpha n=1 Tax=Tilletiaria anomala (strain ATCC 24038 / CBS 436.72 / UBC 951) TaxID=1037660 RepID=A0A066WGG8_TILAU|nr:nagb/rpia/CoA transferase-like protein [Tilletiaria anomala UBC 951]KDN52851.1 nagb/rpia/CoA transferase-like protein [Tilletiaria anomala UBC 951]